MADTTGQIVFACKFKTGSSCMKNEFGGIYCIRTVSEVWSLRKLMWSLYCPVWQTPPLWCPARPRETLESMCKYCLTWIWWQSDLQQLYFIVAAFVIFDASEAQPERCSAESGSAWNSYWQEFAQKNTVEILRMGTLQLGKVSLCIKTSQLDFCIDVRFHSIHYIMDLY